MTQVPCPPTRLTRLEPGQPESYGLEAGICTIGRSPMCQVLIQNLVVSRLHAKIERNGSLYIISDAGSANGTFVNGRRIYEPYLLADGDLIGLGSTTPVLRFERDRTQPL